MGRPRSEERHLATQASAEVQQIRSSRRGREQAKREQLRAELAADRYRPLFDQPLVTTERKQIALKVYGGLSAQSGFPGAWRGPRL